MKKIGIYTHLIAGVTAFCLLFSAAVWYMREAADRHAAATVQPMAEEVVFVLDAGHGGEDCGALGSDGTQEKELNFTITMMLGDLLRSVGYQVVYTREEDRLLYTEEQNIRGQRKMYDLRNRLAIAEAQSGAVLVSIHMNKYVTPSASGLQVYYGSGDSRSRHLAVAIQNSVCSRMQPTNRRVVKAADEGIYLLHHATVPAVLIECGFLSNPEECEKLSQKDYQRRLSFSIFCAMMEYIRTDGGST